MPVNFSTEADVAVLLDRESIRECVYRYCRGIDRLDEEVLRSAYWPDATEDHGGSFKGNASDYCTYVLDRLRDMEVTHHHIGNILIRMVGNVAGVESYFWASHRIGTDPVTDLILAGRYLDRMEKRKNEWRIADRKVVFDWFREMEVEGTREAGFLGQMMRLGKRGSGDLSYDVFRSVE